MLNAWTYSESDSKRWGFRWALTVGSQDLDHEAQLWSKPHGLRPGLRQHMIKRLNNPCGVLLPDSYKMLSMDTRPIPSCKYPRTNKTEERKYLKRNILSHRFYEKKTQKFSKLKIIQNTVSVWLKRLIIPNIKVCIFVLRLFMIIFNFSLVFF